MIAGRFCFDRPRRRSNVPSNNPKLLEALADLVQVLRDPVFDRLSAVPHFTKMGVHSAHHGLGLVAQLPRNRIGGYWRASVQRLQSSGTVGVPKHLGAEAAAGETGAGRDAIEQTADVLNRLFTV